MFCPKCGTQNPENGKFCRGCGTDLATVSDALTGNLKGGGNRNFGMMPPTAQIRDRKGKPVHWEGAITKLFSGLAFLVISIALAFTQMGRGWWFWMLIPAFGALGSGVAQIVQLKANANNLISAPQNSQTFAPVSSASSLPPTQTDYVEPPRKSIYDTGDLVAPPSVVEGTTRHLEINRESETMTLPKDEKWNMEDGK